MDLSDSGYAKLHPVGSSMREIREQIPTPAAQSVLHEIENLVRTVLGAIEIFDATADDLIRLSKLLVEQATALRHALEGRQG